MAWQSESWRKYSKWHLSKCRNVKYNTKKKKAYALPRFFSTAVAVRLHATPATASVTTTGLYRVSFLHSC